MDINEQARLRQWAQDMADQKASGMTVIDWCKANSVKLSTYEKRCKRVRDTMEMMIAEPNKPAISCNADSAAEAHEFVRINKRTSTSSYGIDIQVGNISISIAPDSKDEHVRLVLEAMSHV